MAGARALYGTLLAEGAAELSAGGARYRVHRFRNLRSGTPALALALGEIGGSEPLLARVHSSCVTSEALGACDYGYVLESGRLVLEGTHDALLADEKVKRAYLGM